MFKDFKIWRSKSSQENIFKTISKKVDNECIELSGLCFQDCTFMKNSIGNITKHCNTEDMYNWETIVYLYLLDKQISPLMNSGYNNEITYNTNDKVSLYTYLKSKSNRRMGNLKIVINELFGFISKFREYHFLHGNLHVHNIFVNPKKFPSSERFYVIDFSNSFLLDEESVVGTNVPNYQRSSYFGEMDKKITSIFFEYWDMFTLYVSLKLVLKDDLHQIHYLETVMRNYIKCEDILQRFTEEFLMYNNTNILEFHIHNPNFVTK